MVRRMKYQVLVLVVALFCTPVVPQSPQTRPSYIKSCDEKNPNFKTCALENANYAIPFIVKGDKQVGIPRLDPLDLPLIEIEHNNFKLSLKDVQVSGLKDIKVTSIDLGRTGFDAVFHIENLNIIGTYDIDGKVLLLTLKGQGPANITAVGGDYHVKAKIEPYQKNDIEYLKFVDPQIDFTLTRAYFNFENILNGNQELGSEINQLLNENWQDVLNDLGAPIKETVTRIIESIVSKILERVPANEIL
ncbi:protein takeout isoform X1 [Tribolium castaneum]|nr:PREDICTED: protein takeout [Tribolium castaneum]|eukprot:XP_974890.2 PREDICTED: protein takeout [Tribolium castaneum]